MFKLHVEDRDLLDDNGSDGDSVIMDKEVCDKLLMSDNDHPNLVPVEPPTGGAQVGGPSQVLSNNHGQELANEDRDKFRQDTPMTRLSR